jgi:hypothetical protein
MTLDPMDEALRHRLRQLSARPVDMSRLDARLRARLPARSRPVVLGRRLALAASLLVCVVSLFVVLSLSSKPALAEPASMAQLHLDLVSGRLPMTRVDSLADASRFISQSWENAPALPALPEDHDLACCLKDVKGRRVVCIVLTDGGEQISVVIAPRGEVASPGEGQKMTHSAGEVNMVMKQTASVWVCIMGKVPTARLNEIADGMIAR